MIKLYNEDCIAGMRDAAKVAPCSVDVVVTSPPYNLGVRYGKYDDTQPRESYLVWLSEWACAVKEVLSDDGSLFLNVSGKPSDPCVPFQVLAVMQKHFVLQNTIHWIKSIAVPSPHQSEFAGAQVTIGHYKPINSSRFLNDCHEYVFHLTKSGNVKLDRLSIGVEYQDKSNTNRWQTGKQGLHCRGNTWFVPYKTIRNRANDRPHPATFPPKIPEMCICLHGLARTRLVLDPFAGLGNTAVACAGLGIDFIGFEIDPGYFEYARQVVNQIAKEE